MLLAAISALEVKESKIRSCQPIEFRQLDLPLPRIGTINDFGQSGKSRDFSFVEPRRK